MGGKKMKRGTRRVGRGGGSGGREGTFMNRERKQCNLRAATDYFFALKIS